jgi:hypothetical protein
MSPFSVSLFRFSRFAEVVFDGGTDVNSYSEAVEVLYGKNTFTFASTTPVISHLLNIPTHRIEVMKDVKWRYDPLLPLAGRASLKTFPSRVFLSAEDWNDEMPWLECRKVLLGASGEGAGCVCYQCWPKEVGKDTRVSENPS